MTFHNYYYIYVCVCVCICVCEYMHIYIDSCKMKLEIYYMRYNYLIFFNCNILIKKKSLDCIVCYELCCNNTFEFMEKISTLMIDLLIQWHPLHRYKNCSLQYIFSFWFDFILILLENS